MTSDAISASYESLRKHSELFWNAQVVHWVPGLYTVNVRLQETRTAGRWQNSCREYHYKELEDCF